MATFKTDGKYNTSYEIRFTGKYRITEVDGKTVTLDVPETFNHLKFFAYSTAANEVGVADKIKKIVCCDYRGGAQVGIGNSMKAAMADAEKNLKTFGPKMVDECIERHLEKVNGGKALNQ